MRFVYKEVDDKTNKSNFHGCFNSSYKHRTTDEELYLKPTGLIEKNGRADKSDKKSSGLFPEAKMVNSGLIQKFELETLFAMFYLEDDDYLRFSAAKELKKREWSFNKKFLVWFKRHSKSVESTQVYEKGEFLVFDCEDKWAIKKKNDFKFEYKNLENDFE